MVKLLRALFLVPLVWGSAAPVLASDPAEVMADLLEELTDRQDEPLASVLADLRTECQAGDEDGACEVTALRPFLLQLAPGPAE